MGDCYGGVLWDLPLFTYMGSYRIYFINNISPKPTATQKTKHRLSMLLTIATRPFPRALSPMGHSPAKEPLTPTPFPHPPYRPKSSHTPLTSIVLSEQHSNTYRLGDLAFATRDCETMGAEQGVLVFKVSPKSRAMCRDVQTSCSNLLGASITILASGWVQGFSQKFQDRRTVLQDVKCNSLLNMTPHHSCPSPAQCHARKGYWTHAPP